MKGERGKRKRQGECLRESEGTGGQEGDCLDDRLKETLVLKIHPRLLEIDSALDNLTRNRETLVRLFFFFSCACAFGNLKVWRRTGLRGINQNNSGRTFSAEPRFFFKNTVSLKKGTETAGSGFLFGG